MKSTIKVPLLGGLGNQLFQLAAVIHLNKCYPREFKLVSGLHPLTNKISKRELKLSSILDENEISNFSKFENLRINFALLKKSSSVIRQKYPDENIESKITEKTKSIICYFQELGYVESSWLNLKERMLESNSFKGLVDDVLVDRIAIHFRIGDYLSNPRARKFHGFTDPSYYLGALEKVFDEVGKMPIVIVSDNPKIAKMYLQQFKEFDRATYQFGTSEIEDLQVIAQSSNVIMSNSSFSWWGAWMATKKNASTVIQPRPWYATPETTAENLYNNSWISLQRSVIR